MSGMWFYKMFGQEFGPVSFDELKVIVETGMISSDDEVRPEDSHNWTSVGAVPELNAAGGTSSTTATGSPASTPADSTPADSAMAPAESTDADSNPADSLLADSMLADSMLADSMLADSMLADSMLADSMLADSMLTAVTPTSVAPVSPVIIDAPTSHSLPQTNESAVPQPASPQEGWYCMFHGQEMGPLTFEDLVDFAGQGQLVADDEVKLGAGGKWRRVGSIGRLLSVLPFQEPQIEVAKSTVPSPQPATATQTPAVSSAVQQPSASAVPGQASVQPVPQPNPAVQAVDLELIKAQTAFEATAQAAQQLIAWAYSPNCHPQWWVVLGGMENGPVDFGTIFEWTLTGRLQQTDYVRNGLLGQYGPIGNLPGLFTAAGIMNQAHAAYDFVKSQSQSQSRQAVAVATVPPSSPAATPAPVISQPQPIAPPAASSSAPALSNEAPVAVAPTAPPAPPVAAVPAATPPTPSKPETPAPSPPTRTSPYSSGAGLSSMPSPASASRPVPVPSPRKPSTPARTSSGPSIFAGLSEQLTQPAGIGAIAVLAIAVLIVGWRYMPLGNGRDKQTYRDLKKLLTDVRAARAAKSADFSEFKARADKFKKEYIPRLLVEASSEYPAKQHLLWAVRDELPRMMAGDLTQESQQETDLSARLDNVAKMLNITE